MSECLYLYGMVDGLIHPGLLIGATRGAELDLTVVGRVAAVHSTVDSRDFADLQPDLDEGSRFAELLRRHDEVVTALALAGPVLPARLGTLLPDRAAITQLLERGHASLADALDRIRGHAEWRLDVQCTRSAESAVPEAVSGTAYLQSRRAARDHTERQRALLRTAIESLDEALTFFADDATGLQLGSSGLSVRRAYLVPDSVQQSFVAAAEEGTAHLDRNGCSVRVIGPLPAYSFADLQLGSPAA
jgi:gas vesicle protein GvpL/GvpF